MRENFPSINLPCGGTVADEVGTRYRRGADGHTDLSRYDRDGISLWDPSLRSERKAFLKSWGLVSPAGGQSRQGQN